MKLRRYKFTALDLLPVPTIEMCGIDPGMLRLADAVIVIDDAAPGVGRMTHVDPLVSFPQKEPILFDIDEADVIGRDEKETVTL